MSFRKLLMFVTIIVSSHIIAGNVCQVTRVASSSNVVGSVAKYITSPAVPDTALFLVAAKNSTFSPTTFTVVRQTMSSGELHFEPICYLSFYTSVAPPFSLAADGSALTVQDAAIDGSQIRVLRLPPTGSVGSVPLCSAVGTLGPILSGGLRDTYRALLSSAFTPPASNDSLAALGLVRQQGTQLNDVVCITVTGGSSAVTQNCLSSVVSFGLGAFRSFTAVSESQYFAATFDRFVLITRTASVKPHLTDAFVTVLGGGPLPASNVSFTSVHSATVTSANRGLIGLSVEWVGSVVVVMPARSPGCGAQVIIPSGGVNASWLSVNISDAVLPDSDSAELADLCAAGPIDVAVMSGGLQFVSLEGEARTLYVTPSCPGGASPSTAKSGSSPNEVMIAVVAACVVVIVVVCIVMVKKFRSSPPPAPGLRDDDRPIVNDDGPIVKLSSLVVEMYFTDGNGQRLSPEQEKSIASQPVDPEMNALGGDLTMTSSSANGLQGGNLGSDLGATSTRDDAAPQSESEEMLPRGDVLASDVTLSVASRQSNASGDGWSSATTEPKPNRPALEVPLLRVPGRSGPPTDPATETNHAEENPGGNQPVQAVPENIVLSPPGFSSAASGKTLVVQQLPNTVVNFFLRRDKELGRGGQGEVFVATNKDGGEAYAIKIVQNLSVWSRVEKVAKALHEKSHVNVIRPIAAGKTEIGVVMLMELALDSLKERSECHLNPSATARYIRGVLHGLCHIHRLGLVHNDLKLQNVLVTQSGVVKITDFDLSTAEGEWIGCRVGTLRYIAPESLQDVTGRVVRQPSFDIWAVGVMVWEMLSGSRFLANLETDDVVPVVRDITSFDDLDTYLPNAVRGDDAALYFVRQCMNPDPTQRPTAEELLKHPFTTLQ